MTNTAERICVVGAGSSGLAAARNLIDCGFEVDVVEAQSDIGGIWNYSTRASRVYESTGMISSKPLTRFPDFPMAAELPDYLSHREVLDYLKADASHFDIVGRIRFNVRVQLISRGSATGWTVGTSDGKTTDYRAVVVANGHNWSPRIPSFEGRFSGVTMHSADYRTPDILTGKRVLVIGQGNSGCDIAVEAALCANRVVSSSRRGYHFIPKYVGGRPADQMADELLAMGLSLDVRRRLTLWAIHTELGDLSESGLAEPDHQLFESHPIINSNFPLAVRGGAIVPKPAVARFDGHSVLFADGSSEPIDVIILATGYQVELPFLKNMGLSWNGAPPALHLNAFHQTYDDLFFAGFIQPDGGQFGLVHWQMRTVALYLRGVDSASCGATRLRERKRDPARPSSGGIRYLPAARHALEVEHWSYLNELRALAAELEQ